MTEVTFQQAMTWCGQAFRNADIDGVFSAEDMEDIRAALDAFAKRHREAAEAERDARIDADDAPVCCGCGNDPGAVAEAIAALEKAERVFAHYADLHKAKGTRDGDQKAATNLAYSMEMGEARQALEGREGETT